MASKKQTIKVADLLSEDDDRAADAYADAMADMIAEEAPNEANEDADYPTPTGPTNETTFTSSFAVIPDRIAQIAERSERLAREVPITDRLGRRPTAERVAKAKQVAAPKTPKVKTPKEPPLCECGCGARTGGGHFLPGHDAKLKSRLFTEARSDDDTIRVNAIQRLTEKDWLKLMGTAKVAKPKASTADLTDEQLTALIDSWLLGREVGVVERTEALDSLKAAIKMASPLSIPD